MRTLLHSIGTRMIALALVLGWQAAIIPSAHALTSTSFQLETTFGGAATNNTDATNLAEGDGEMTWYTNNLASTNYMIVSDDDTSTASSASSSSTGGGSTGGGGSQGGGGGGGYTTIPDGAAHPVVPGTNNGGTSSSSRSRTPLPHPAPSGASSSNVSAQAVAASSLASSEHITTSVSTVEDAWNSFTRMSFSLTTPMSLHFFDACEHQTTHTNWSLMISWLLIVLSTLLIALNTVILRKVTTITRRNLRKTKRRMIVIVVISTIAAIIACLLPITAHAANQTTPLLRAYNGTLLDSSGNAITSAVSIRFSYWKSADYVNTDTTGTGAINTGATNYVGWQEVQTVTPTSKGTFSLNLGAVTPLIDLSSLPVDTLTHLFLQVEVKMATDPDTSYELLDVNSSSDTVDRSQVTSVPFARNSDLLDQHDTGTGSGNIPVLEFGGRLPISTMAGGTNLGTFTIDADDTETSDITLQFGTALGKKLTYSVTQGLFIFNASVKVQGNLTVTGLINGVDITTIASLGDALKATSGSGLDVNVHGGNYRLNGTVTNFEGNTVTMNANALNYVFFGSGGLTKNTSGFPSDESYIPVAEVTTGAGSITTIADRRITSNDDRERDITTTFTPEYEKASYQGDGADNVGQLVISHDNITLKNFYLWNTTKSTMQDYDLLLRVPVSNDFVRWKQTSSENPLSLDYRTTNASSAMNKLDIQVYDTSGVPVTLSGATSNLAGTSWATTQIEFTGSPTWTAGQDMLIRIKFSAKDSAEAHLGSLRLQHVDFTH